MTVTGFSLCTHRIDASSLASLKNTAFFRGLLGERKKDTGIWCLVSRKNTLKAIFSDDVFSWTVPFFHWKLWVISLWQHPVSLCKGLCKEVGQFLKYYLPETQQPLYIHKSPISSRIITFTCSCWIFQSHVNWFLGIRNDRKVSILLMEEILHHLRCIKPCKWDKLPTSTYQLVSRISSINSIALRLGYSFFSARCW